MYEALYGGRPFLGTDVGEVRRRILGGAVTAPPAATAVPSRVWRVLARGLSADPRARFPSMTALLDALTDDADARRRRWMVLGGALAGAVAAGALAVYALLASSRGDSTLLQALAVSVREKNR